MHMIIRMTEEANAILSLLKAGNNTQYIADKMGLSLAHVNFIAEQLRMFAFI